MLLLSTSVLRSESLHRAEASDFFGLVPPMKHNDVHKMHLQIHQIAIGKTTHGMNQWGRATRHIDPRLCAIGGTALHMEMRESQMKEFTKMSKEEWKDNSEWFDIKFLVDVNNSDTTKEMVSDTHGSKVKAIPESLGLPTNKVLHLGRNIGTKCLDCVEVDPDEVKRMGQWNQSVREKAHSAKLPMKAIRSLGGLTQADGMHFNTKTQVMPPDELIKLTWLGSLACNMLDEMTTEECSQNPTAFGALNWMKDLAIAFSQDCLALQILYPNRGFDALARDLPPLRSAPFKASCHSSYRPSI